MSRGRRSKMSKGRRREREWSIYRDRKRRIRGIMSKRNKGRRNKRRIDTIEEGTISTSRKIISNQCSSMYCIIL